MFVEGKNSDVVLHLKQYIKDLYAKRASSYPDNTHFTEEHVQCTQQTNNWDCGVYTIANAVCFFVEQDHLLYGNTVRDKMSEYRKKMCLDCRRGKILSIHL